jgi:hypothetical protein
MPRPLTRALLVGAGLLGASATLADRGSIPFQPHAQIFEPVQRAMIAWNGQEEILLLSTDLRASELTNVLEVLPLPAEPQVTKGDTEVFRRATDLINRKLAEKRPASAGQGARAESTEPAGEVTFHERIGAHDISVTKVLSPQGFTDWVKDYLRKAGVENPQISRAMMKLIGEYLDDKYEWFVFDVVELGTEPRTNDAIQYRFASTCLYYPLRISRLEEGETDIQLLVLTPKRLSNFPALPRERVQLAHAPVTVTGDELRALNPDMHALLGRQSAQQLRIWTLRGQPQTFHADLVAN